MPRNSEKLSPSAIPPKSDCPQAWEAYFAAIGMGLCDEISKNQIPLGDGLGRQSDYEEDIEDGIDSDTGFTQGHSSMCPLNLGRAVDDTQLHQPNERPVEANLNIE
jgi:hypothetical protein